MSEMSQPLHERHDESSSPNQMLRTQKSFKRRFAFDELDNEQSAVQARPEKRRDQKTFIASDVFKNTHRNIDEQFSNQTYNIHHQQRSCTPPEFLFGRRRLINPDPPVLLELQEKYSNLQIAMHSQIVSELESTQEKLTSEALTAIKTNQLALARISASHAKVTTPAREAQTQKIMISPGGKEHPQLVEMGAAVADFQKRINQAQTELKQLWADWEAAQADIEALGRGVLLPDKVDDEPGVDEGTGSDHVAAVVEFDEDIEALGVKAVEEINTYEKEFHKKIEGEASKIVQAFVQAGFSY